MRKPWRILAWLGAILLGVPLLLQAARECEEALQRFAPRLHSGPVETIVL